MVETTEERDSAGNLAANDELTKTFLKLSGYRADDIVGSNQSRRSFITSNGGKYVILKSGRTLRTLQGPPTPKQRSKAAEEGDDE